MYSLLNSKKKCLSQLAKKTIHDPGSISGQNINLIASSSGYNRYTIMNMTPNCVANAITYSPIPKESQWKVSQLKELISLHDGDLYMAVDESGNGFQGKTFKI